MKAYTVITSCSLRQALQYGHRPLVLFLVPVDVSTTCALNRRFLRPMPQRDLGILPKAVFSTAQPTVPDDQPPGLVVPLGQDENGNNERLCLPLRIKVRYAPLLWPHSPFQHTSTILYRPLDYPVQTDHCHQVSSASNKPTRRATT